MFQVGKKTINGIEYEVTPLGAVVGRKALTRLIKLAGPALEKGSLAELAQGLSESEHVDYFCDLFAAQTRITTGVDKNGLPIQPLLSDTFNTHFAGNYGSLVQWLRFCLELNFGSFFVDLGDVLKGASKKTPPSK